MASWKDILGHYAKQFIRRYHSTPIENVESILRDGLKADAPKYRLPARLGDKSGVYTTVYPSYSYFQPDVTSADALAVINIPKAQYSRLKRKRYNPESPNRRRSEFAKDTWFDWNDELEDSPIEAHYSVWTVPEGRVDIFDEDIPSAWIHDFIYPNDNMQVHSLKYGDLPDLDWNDLFRNQYTEPDELNWFELFK